MGGVKLHAVGSGHLGDFGREGEPLDHVAALLSGQGAVFPAARRAGPIGGRHGLFPRHKRRGAPAGMLKLDEDLRVVAVHGFDEALKARHVGEAAGRELAGVADAVSAHDAGHFSDDQPRAAAGAGFVVGGDVLGDAAVGRA